MISALTTPLVLVAVAVVGLFNVPLPAIVSFCITIGSVCLLIGFAELKTWIKVRKDILAIDGVLQLFTGVSGLVCGMILIQ